MSLINYQRDIVSVTSESESKVLVPEYLGRKQAKYWKLSRMTKSRLTGSEKSGESTPKMCPKQTLSMNSVALRTRNVCFKLVEPQKIWICVCNLSRFVLFRFILNSRIFLPKILLIMRLYVCSLLNLDFILSTYCNFNWVILITLRSI